MSFHVHRLSVIGLIACLAVGAQAADTSIFDNGGASKKPDNKELPTDKDELAAYEKHQQAMLALEKFKNGLAAEQTKLDRALEALMAEKKAAFQKEDLDAASAAQAKIEAKRKESDAIRQAVAAKEDVVGKIREMRQQVGQAVMAKKNALASENLEAAKGFKEKIEGLKTEMDVQLRLLVPAVQVAAQAGSGAAQPGAAEGFATFKDREIEVAANNAQGESLGKIETGSLVKVEFVSGKWAIANGDNAGSPIENSNGFHWVAIVGWTGNAPKVICVVHPNLLKEGFSLRIADEFDRLCLRVNDNPNLDSYGDNSGSCKFKVSVSDPKQGILKPGVLDDRKRWFKGFWQRYDNGSATPWGPIWCFSAGGDAVARNRDGSKAIDLGDWTMDCHGEITWQEGAWVGHVFVDSARKAHGYYIKGEDGSMTAIELKSWTPPKPAEFHPSIKVGR